MSCRKGAVVAFLFWAASRAAAEDLDPLLQREVQQSRVVLEELRASRERMEKSAPLSTRAIELLKTEKYHEAEQALVEWEAADPEDPRLPGLKELASRLKVEPDPARQADLWAEYLSKTLEELQPKKENFVHRDY